MGLRRVRGDILGDERRASQAKSTITNSNSLRPFPFHYPFLLLPFVSLVNGGIVQASSARLAFLQHRPSADRFVCSNFVLPANSLECITLSESIYIADAQITAPWEVEALKAIKGSLIDPQGRLKSWNLGDPCMGKWSHVLCHNATANDGYFHVQELQLLQLNLSGTLSPEIGRLSHMQIMDFMWNSINGSIPKEVGNITSLKLLLLNGNQLSGSLPEEIGFLPNLDRIQIDQNNISGPIPKSFAYLNKTKHFHMNNNSLSGQIPPELSRLPSLVHLLLDNNNLSGYLPPELSKLPKLLIIQLDNNNFSGSSIPSSYGNITTLLKLSLRNCSLEGPVPDVSGIPQLGYLYVQNSML
ncbi:hypothetical protein GUJ93_ZPchr0006g43140 [Zizania palustris]|uniref:non-specific serine/threonine protein kinase n=1 Tax=Zizania palustris TaxID=103762 RepID=A0A8J5SKF5_ZIZPA|nr:hypothetical protein GUJ93_ZPchr0006g43140 [Zizania palustris]